MRTLTHVTALAALLANLVCPLGARAQAGDSTLSQGIWVFYDVSGKGASVVLLHGLGLNRQMWDPQVEALAREFRVIRVDFPGAGRSAAPTGPVSFATVVADVIRAAGGAPAHVMGLSNGGQIAVDLALTNPELVRSLVLADAAVAGFRFSEDMLGRVRGYAVTASQQGVPQANAAWLNDPLFVPARRDSLVARRLNEIVLPYSGEYWLHAGWRRAVSPPAIARLREIRVPTLVVVGELDVPDFLAQADTLARKIPGARRIVMKGIGHMSNMEDASTFNSIALDFLRAIAKE